MAGSFNSSIHPIIADIASESAVSRSLRAASFASTWADLRLPGQRSDEGVVQNWYSENARQQRWSR